ncbi:Inositol polyphosphate 1-phosphatase [Nymphon striatum]|nr:Inositol polyphosphate 1-phosphatase [Nymphon striatum]
MALLLQTLLSASEKAANIARVIRSDCRLFHMLIEEKTGESKNKRFVQDFKTLADVLIQETVKHDIGIKFPSLAGNIKGEESNTFTNTIGESICVEVKDTEAETCILLEQVLGGDSVAALVLAQAVHSKIKLDVLSEEQLVKIQSKDFPVDELGIWIDPIDGTSEYIQGKENVASIRNIYPHGLQCCTILIGVYNLTNGIPVMGVINQPFHSFDVLTKQWSGKEFWGWSTKSTSLTSITLQKKVELNKPVIVVSSNEAQWLKQQLSDNGYIVLHGSGAGYKLLCVFLGLAQIYFLSQDSTFKWDTCAPHSLLSALGGNIVDYHEATSNSNIRQLSYHEVNEGTNGLENWGNLGGLIAYVDEEMCSKFIKTLKKICPPD